MASLDGDPEEWGSGTWITTTMKSLRARTPGRIDSFIQMDVPVLVTLLCNTCSGHSRTIISNRHPNEYRNIVDKRGELIGMFAWMHDIHNDVNQILGKPEVSWKDACKMYKPLLMMSKEDFELEAELISDPDTISDIPMIEYPVSMQTQRASRSVVKPRRQYIPRTNRSRITQSRCTTCNIK